MVVWEYEMNFPRIDESLVHLVSNRHFSARTGAHQKGHPSINISSNGSKAWQC